MKRIVASIAFTSCLALLPFAALAAGERQACLDTCHVQAEACELERCGEGEPAVDSTCARVCGERYKRCKADCPQ
jgi:hypothetical protein